MNRQIKSILIALVAIFATVFAKAEPQTERVFILSGHVQRDSARFDSEEWTEVKRLLSEGWTVKFQTVSAFGSIGGYDFTCVVITLQAPPLGYKQ